MIFHINTNNHQVDVIEKDFEEKVVEMAVGKENDIVTKTQNIQEEYIDDNLKMTLNKPWPIKD